MNFSTSSPATDLGGSEYLFLGLAAFFFAMGLCFILFILLSRIYKSYDLGQREYFTLQFKEKLGTLIISESEGDFDLSYVLFQRQIDELKTLAGNSNRGKQILVDQLVALNKNLTGALEKSITKVFVGLGLDDFCLAKLKSLSATTRATGIRELTDLNHTSSLAQIKKFLKARNKTVRQEALMANLKMDRNNPFSFLDDFDGEITPWLQINIHYQISKLDARTLPVFSKWFSSTNRSVVLFAISMVRQFRQMSGVPGLMELLHHTDSTLVEAAVKTLGQMEVYESADKIAALVTNHWENEKTSIAIVRSLSKIAQESRHIDAIVNYLNHPTYEVQAEAVLALSRLGRETQKQLEEINLRDDGKLSKMIAHANEPLLN